MKVQELNKRYSAEHIALNLTLKGPGIFNIKLNATQLTTRLCGYRKLRGNATNHTALLTSIVSLRSYQLETEMNLIIVEWVGSADVTVTKSRDVSITGAGSVEYHGALK